MKKIIISAIAIMAVSGNLFAQEAKEEMRSFMEGGLLKWKSESKGVSFRVGARAAVDAGYYFDDVTDRSSGANFSEARLRIYSTFAKNFDAKFDVDFAGNKVSLKDLYVRYHLGKNGMFYLGNYAEPFSADNIQSTGDMSFMFKPATIDALGTGRALGISYRYYGNMFWGEAGAFSEKLSTNNYGGDKGWSVSSRMLFRMVKNDDYGFHVGGSVNNRRPDAAGFTSGKDDFNRIATVNSSLESAIDKTKFLDATVQNANNVFKYGFEAMGFWKKFYVQGEYIGTSVDRKKDWDYLFQQQLGGMWSYTTMESYKKWYGEDRTINFSGYYAQVGWLICGGNYSYNKTNALMNRPGKGAFEVLLRYNHTNLDDVDGEWFDGKFFDKAATGKPNNSVSGGKVNSYSLGLNYYVAQNLILKLNYNYQKLDSYRFMDKNLNSVMCRVFFEF